MKTFLSLVAFAVGSVPLLPAADREPERANVFALYHEVWDPVLRLPRATMPLLWLSSELQTVSPHGSKPSV